MLKFRQNNLNGVTPDGGTKCGWGNLNAGVVAKIGDIQLSLVASLSHCSMFPLSAC